MAERLGQVHAAEYASVDLLHRLAGEVLDVAQVVALRDEIDAAITADKARVEAGVRLCERLQKLAAVASRETPTGF